MQIQLNEEGIACGTATCCEKASVTFWNVLKKQIHYLL
jgi:hypothetical protein